MTNTFIKGRYSFHDDPDRYGGERQWGNGAWDGEPDWVVYTHQVNGYMCVALRHPQSGNWCAYVGITESHPFFNCHYDECQHPVDVNGGLTYSGTLEHVVGLPPEVDEMIRGYWYLGFDYGHMMKNFVPLMYGPKMRELMIQSDERRLADGDELDFPVGTMPWEMMDEGPPPYASIEYVLGGLGDLASQLDDPTLEPRQEEPEEEKDSLIKSLEAIHEAQHTLMWPKKEEPDG